MIDQYLSSPEMVIGLVLSLLGVAFGIVRRENIGVAAKAIGSSSTTKKIVAYLTSEYADDVSELLKGNKAAYVFDLAKKDENMLKALCKLSTVATLDEMEAMVKLSPTADMVKIEDTISIFQAKLRECRAFNTEIPEQYKENVCKGVANACMNGKE